LRFLRGFPDELTQESRCTDGLQARISALAAMQQQQLQQQLLAQQLLMQQQTAQQGNKKQREVYVGNLTIGVVTEMMIRELFNGALATLVPDPHTNPPVVNCQLDPTGRFAFVELRSEELATSAMSLDKVDLCGRSINVGRPKGYVEPPTGPAKPAQVVSQGYGIPNPAAAAVMAAAGGVPGPFQPTCNLLLQNLLPVKDLRVDEERSDLEEDVKEECNKDGRQVLGIVCPKPPDTAVDDTPGRVYVKFANAIQAKSAHALMDGRQFDGNKVEARYISDQQYTLAAGGAWLDHSAAPPAPQQGDASAAATAASLVPGGMPPPAASFPVGMASLPNIQMNPALVHLASSNPQLAALMGMQQLPK